MTKDEINKALQEWDASRQSLACPMAQVPCILGRCRFWLPMVVGQIVGPNLPPLLNMQWMCQFDQAFNMLGEIERCMPRRPGKAPASPHIIVPGDGN